MTFTNLKLQVANDIGYTDSAGAILTGKDITETDIGKWINNRYLYDIFPALSAQYPEDFVMESVSPNWSRNSTILTNDENVLVDVDSQFLSGDIGNYVYNVTEGEWALIKGYTNTSTVTLEHEMGWTAGDVIKVVERQYALGGDAIDSNNILSVFVKYNSTGDYVQCSQRDFNDLSASDEATYNQTKPYFYLTTMEVSGVQISAIGIVQKPYEPVDDAIKIRYVQTPTEMSAAGDKPKLPYAFHKLLIMGATIDCYKRLGMIAEARALENDYQAMKMMEISTYPLTRSSGPSRVKGSRSLVQFVTREK